MKTLVIHPEDYSTDFLKEVYKDMVCTVISSLTISKKILKQAIKEHDRIIIMGHGSENGLFGKNRFIIDSNFVYLLREKQNAIYIWCNADKFCEKYDLKGFRTGMIISEYEEALNYAIKASVDEIVFSNQLFAKAIKHSISGTTPDMVSLIKEIYYSDENPIIFFNEKNLHYI